MSDLRITVADMRRVGVCPDARKMFFERHGLDWKDFLRNGISAEEARRPGDNLDLIDKLEQAARERVAHGR